MRKKQARLKRDKQRQMEKQRREYLIKKSEGVKLKEQKIGFFM